MRDGLTIQPLRKLGIGESRLDQAHPRATAAAVEGALQIVVVLAVLLAESSHDRDSRETDEEARRRYRLALDTCNGLLTVLDCQGDRQ